MVVRRVGCLRRHPAPRAPPHRHALEGDRYERPSCAPEGAHIVLLTTDRPAPNSAGQRALDAVTGEDKSFRAVPSRWAIPSTWSALVSSRAATCETVYRSARRLGAQAGSAVLSTARWLTIGPPSPNWPQPWACPGTQLCRTRLRHGPPSSSYEPDESANLECIWNSGSRTSVAETAFCNGADFASHTDGAQRACASSASSRSGRRRIPGDRPDAGRPRSVDRVYMVSCKYLSRILHNTARAACVHRWSGRDFPVPRDQLVPRGRGRGPRSPLRPDRGCSRTDEHGRVTSLADSRASERSSGSPSRNVAAPGLTDRLDTEYERLIGEVSRESAPRWEAELGDRGQQERMLCRLLRIYSSTYFILGNDD